jgi:hypothetical protein
VAAVMFLASYRISSTLASQASWEIEAGARVEELA